MNHSSHSMAQRSDISGQVCTTCYACECCAPITLAQPCENPALVSVSLWKGELPVYYEHGQTVTGKAEGVRKGDGTVVIEVTLLPGEAGEKILEMLQGKVPLALSWALRIMEVKRVPRD